MLLLRSRGVAAAHTIAVCAHLKEPFLLNIDAKKGTQGMSLDQATYFRALPDQVSIAAFEASQQTHNDAFCTVATLIARMRYRKGPVRRHDDRRT